MGKEAIKLLVIFFGVFFITLFFFAFLPSFLQ